MYPPSKFLKMGLSVESEDPVHNSTNTAYVLDMTQATPTWRQVASMANKRAYHIATCCPTASVLVTGGGPTTAATNTSARRSCRPSCGRRRRRPGPRSAPMTPRASTTRRRLLMPDGRVLISGGGRDAPMTQPTDQFNTRVLLAPVPVQGPAAGHHLGAHHAALQPDVRGPDADAPQHRVGLADAPGSGHPLGQHEPAFRAAGVHHEHRFADRHRAASNTQAPSATTCCSSSTPPGCPRLAAIVRL